MIAPDGRPIAFPAEEAKVFLADREAIEFEGVTITLTDGLRAFDSEGAELATHQSFWFAWSQFHPGTLLWSSLED